MGANIDSSIMSVSLITRFSVYPLIIPLYAANASVQAGDILAHGDTKSRVQLGKRRTWPPRVQVYLDSVPW